MGEPAPSRPRLKRGGRSPDRFVGVRDALLHLRFPFVLILSPIYVWGAYWAPGGWSPATTLGFLLVHLALYPGANAFNTAYDRDEGPIGGLAKPPPVPAGLARWSTALQATGAVLAPLVGVGFAVTYLALWAIFTAYSHPRTRWKRSPVVSTIAIVVGQGGLGFGLGWTAAGGGWPPGPDGALAAAAAVTAVAAMWPWTQLYQVEADRARSERTLADRLGVRGTLGWTASGLALAAGSLAALGQPIPAGIAAVGAGGAMTTAVTAPAGWAPDHRTTMIALYALSMAFLIWTIVTWR